MHAHALAVNIEQIEHVFLHPQGRVRKKWQTITTPTTLCLSCVITLHIHRRTEPTSMPVLRYSFHMQLFFKISNDAIIKVLHLYGSQQEV